MTNVLSTPAPLLPVADRTEDRRRITIDTRTSHLLRRALRAPRTTPTPSEQALAGIADAHSLHR